MSLPVTEDTPPDMLAGSMDLNVVLPYGKTVKMSIQRSTPMMDLLVQVTTAHRLSPGNHSIQAMGDKGMLPYKPSTPIGTLDAFTIKIVDKKFNNYKKAPQAPQSFLNTFRLQVNLPRSQLFVVRVTPDITLAEILTHVCTEKNLDMNKYEFRNPGNPDDVLDLGKTLGNYKIQELSLVNKNSRAVPGLLSSADIIHVKSSKHRQNSVCDSSLSSGSLGSRSTSPVPVNFVRMPPQPPLRKKRRPAPKPPQSADIESKEVKPIHPVLISHSRESSDSSGYHEASVLSESPTHGMTIGRSESHSPPDTLPRNAKLPPSQSYNNLTTIQPMTRMRLGSCVSNASINSSGVSRKKRAAPPPPKFHSISDEKIKSSTLPTSRAEERIVSNIPFVPAVNKQKLGADDDEKIDCVKINAEAVKTIIVSDAEDAVAKPVPKPRTLFSTSADEEEAEEEEKEKLSVCRSQTDSDLVTSAEEDGKLSKESFAEPKVDDRFPSRTPNLKIVKSEPEMRCDEDNITPTGSQLERWRNADTLACLNENEVTKSAWLLGDSEASGDTSPLDEIDHDSINWQYQLPSPPTDFRDTNSPNCTEFETVTITPDLYKEEEERGSRVVAVKEPEPKRVEEVKGNIPLKQKQTAIMSELTNVLSDTWMMKGKASSVTNLNEKKGVPLNYSKSFSMEIPPTMKNFKMVTYGAENNRCDKYEKEIKYKNYKNLEKSLSMECIRTRPQDEAENKADEGFRKPVAPVQKKLKLAKRSTSTVGVNGAQRRSASDADHDADAEKIAALRQQFLEFLKEKNLSSDLNMKSLNVMRHILPQINSQQHSELDLTKEEASHVSDKKIQNRSYVKMVDFKRNGSALMEREVKENVVIVEKEAEFKKKPEVEIQAKPEPEGKKVTEVVKRFSYHAPPSINFATWGERPKTQVFIKDEDYVTEEKVTLKKVEKKPVEETPKPVVMKKPNTIPFKKPGVKSHYEMFSALPRKKEVTSLDLIHMEEEEKRKKKMEEESKKPSRVPVVCGMELKKEFKDQQGNKSISVTEVTLNPEVKAPHSVSIYINGNQRNEPVDKRNLAPPKPIVTDFVTQKRNCSLMPVVKGFRTPVEQPFQSHLYMNKISNINSINTSVSYSHNNNSNNNSNNNNFSIDISANNTSAIKDQKFRHVTEVSVPPPPPPPAPPATVVTLKPASARQQGNPKTHSLDPRDRLMEEIRNFRGFTSHKLRTAQ